MVRTVKDKSAAKARRENKRVAAAQAGKQARQMERLLDASYGRVNHA